MLYVNSVLFIVRWLAVGLLAIDLALVVFILYRRITRNRYYSRKDFAQRNFTPTIVQFLDGRLELDAAVALLQPRTHAEREAVKSLLLSGMTEPTRDRATGLLLSLGYVSRWAEQAFGKRRARQLLLSIASGQPVPIAGAARPLVTRVRRFRLFAISRALAAGYLARLSPSLACMFALEALQDPSPYVGRLTVAALGRYPMPDGVPILLNELRRAVEGETELPVRSVKTALVRYGAPELHRFTAVMDHPQARFRFLIVDTVREICRKAESFGGLQDKFPPDLRAWFLDKGVADSSADVRARSAAVIACFREPRAAEALRALLRDDNEFVRLHAVRACADPYYAMLLLDVAQRMTDPRWRVREAAVRTLAAFGATGRRQLEQFFVNTSDRYASEQIAEELQRSRMGMEIISALALRDRQGDGAVAACAKLVSLEMDSLLTEVLVRGDSAEVRGALLEILSASQRPHFLSVLRNIAAQQTDPLQQRAAVLLSNLQVGGATAVGAAI